MSMEKSREIVLDVKAAMTQCLSEMVEAALDEGFITINKTSSVQPEALKLRDGKKDIMQRFSDKLGANFDKLIDDKVKGPNVIDYESLSLLGEEDLESIIAMEGMIAHARNCDMQQYLAFSTRLDTLFVGAQIDESNNPMDPEQIGDAFREAMRPTELNPVALLMAYRQFNSKVFHELETALA
jgi:hypothetical protein